MTDFLDSESDESIAESMGLTLAQFRGEEPFEHICPPMTCGEDDAQIDHAEYLKRVISYRKEYDSFEGEGTIDGYLKIDKDGVGYRCFQDYVICQEMKW